MLMKRLLVSLSLLALACGGNVSYAQVAESAEWATRIKAEGLARHRLAPEAPRRLADACQAH